MPRFKPLLTALALLTGTVVARDAQPLLLVLPLDTLLVTVAPGVSVAALTDGKPARRNVPSPAALLARALHPAFGKAIAHAARGVEVIDSSAARPPVTWPDPDSSRFTLVVEDLTVTQEARTVARRTVPRSLPDFDPTTGLLTPGGHRSYSEGPGRMTTLTATATWSVWDHAGDSALAAGTALGTTEFRGDARRATVRDWEAAARALALDVLRRTPFTPDGTPPAAVRARKPSPKD